MIIRRGGEAGGGQLLIAALRMHIRVALQKQTDNFMVAIFGRMMQWSLFTAENQKNEIAPTQSFAASNKITKTRITIITIII
jgi:hypothetical protein